MNNVKDDNTINLARIIESSDDAIIRMSLDGIILSWNYGAEKIFRYSADEIIGKNISLIIPPEFIKDDENHLHWISNNEIVDRYETISIKKNGEQLYVSMSISYLKDKTGNITGVYQVARDITSQKKSESELIEAYKELAFQNKEKDKRAEELLIANIELAFQNGEKEKRAAEFHIANNELLFQTDQKAKRADELIIANKELAFQNEEKHKRAEELLIANKELDFLNKEQQALFASIVNSSDDAMLSKTLDGIITSWNYGAEKIFGYSADEIIGKNILTLIPPPLQHEEADVTKKIQKGETVAHYETKRIRKDGSTFHASLTISPIRNFEGNIIGASKVLMDITKQKETEQKLSASLKELADYKFALDQSSIVALTDQKGVIKYVNDKFLAISKYSREELIGQDHRIINSGYHPKSFIKNLWVTIANGNIWKGELKNKAKDGSTYWVDTTIIPFLDIDGKPYQYIAIRTDITEQKEKERHLKLLESVITNTADSVMITEAEPFDEPGHRIVFVNEAFTKMTGYSSEEIIGKTPRILQGPKSDKVALKRLGETIRKWQPCEINTINYKKNGEEYWVNFSVSPVANELGWYTHFISIERDITDQKLAEFQLNKLNSDLQKHAKKLALSNAELEQFAYVASHDLQEPLRMITNFLTQLEKKYGDKIDDNGKKYIGFAVDGAKRMRQIILDLLEYSKIGKSEEAKEELDLNKLIDEIKILFLKTIEDKKAVFIIDELPTINAYRSPMIQVFQNLISNALKYSNNNIPTQIHVTVKDLKGYWQFAVSDNGIGIEKDYFNKIFIIFQRLHSKQEYPGIGIGLAMVKKIIETEGGAIWVESEVGKGSAFYFTIKK